MSRIIYLQLVGWNKEMMNEWIEEERREGDFIFSKKRRIIEKVSMYIDF